MTELEWSGIINFKSRNGKCWTTGTDLRYYEGYNAKRTLKNGKFEVVLNIIKSECNGIPLFEARVISNNIETKRYLSKTPTTLPVSTTPPTATTTSSTHPECPACPPGTSQADQNCFSITFLQPRVSHQCTQSAQNSLQLAKTASPATGTFQTWNSAPESVISCCIVA